MIRNCTNDDIDYIVAMTKNWCEESGFKPFDPIRTATIVKKSIESDNFLVVRDEKGLLIAERCQHPYIAATICKIHAIWHPENGMELIRYFHKWSRDCHIRMVQSGKSRANQLFKKLGYKTVEKVMVFQ